MCKVLITTTITTGDSCHVDTRIVDCVSPAEAEYAVNTVNGSSSMEKHSMSPLRYTRVMQTALRIT
jgi:hypothetical protein